MTEPNDEQLGAWLEASMKQVWTRDGCRTAVLGHEQPPNASPSDNRSVGAPDLLNEGLCAVRRRRRCHEMPLTSLTVTGRIQVADARPRVQQLTPSVAHVASAAEAT